MDEDNTSVVHSLRRLRYWIFKTTIRKGSHVVCLDGRPLSKPEIEVTMAVCNNSWVFQGLPALPAQQDGMDRTEERMEDGPWEMDGTNSI